MKLNIKKGDEVIGNQTRVKVVKNKLAPPFRQTEFDIIYNEGISKEGELIDIGSNLEIVDKTGAWYAYNKEKIGQGKDNARLFLKEHADIAAEIEKRIREKTIAKPASVAVDTDEEMPEEAEA